VLVATGSPRASSFSLPAGVDVVKLPAATKSTAGAYEARTLNVSLDDLAKLRGAIVRSAVKSFRPSVVLVDHAPLGLAGELTSVLRRLPRGARRPQILLGMRDIVDVSEHVERQWHEGGQWDALREHYDGVLVYGDPVVMTTAVELGLAGRLGVPVRHVGFVAPQPATDPVLGKAPSQQSKRERTRRPTLLVTVGGGGDGLPVLEAYERFLRESPDADRLRSVLVTGPLVSGGPVADLIDRVTRLGRPVEVLRFTDRMEDLLGTADGVISMAGYNTVAELLAARVPAMLVPRRFPRLEQWLRATRLAPVADLTPVAAEDVTCEHVERFVERLCSGESAREHQLDIGGAQAAATAVLEAARSGGRAAA
jgi:predicted glycosyltransferase